MDLGWGGTIQQVYPHLSTKLKINKQIPEAQKQVTNSTAAAIPTTTSKQRQIYKINPGKCSPHLSTKIKNEQARNSTAAAIPTTTTLFKGNHTLCVLQMVKGICSFTFLGKNNLE